jgi:hypothetical protein
MQPSDRAMLPPDSRIQRDFHRVLVMPAEILQSMPLLEVRQQPVAGG